MALIVETEPVWVPNYMENILEEMNIRYKKMKEDAKTIAHSVE